MQQAFTVPNTNFPGLNEIIKTAKAHPMAYSSLKKRWGELVCLYIKKAKLKPMKGPVQIHFTWVEKTKRRDPDNVRAGSKFCLDALVKTGIIPCDSQRTIWQISDSFLVHKDNWRVDVLITEMEDVMTDAVRRERATVDVLQTMDANVWATEFMRLFQDRKEYIDHGLMLAWFANAIMRGFDEATRRHAAALADAMATQWDPLREEAGS